MTLRNAVIAAFAASMLTIGGGVGRCAPAVAETGLSLVREVTLRGELILGDERRVCLDGVFLGDWRSDEPAAMAAARRALDELVGGRPVRIDDGETARFDRYGCRLAEVTTADGALLQEALLERGLALVRPSARAADDQIDRWLALEARAREAGVGLWRNGAAGPISAAGASRLIGRIGLVEGRVVRSSDNDRYVYLNFGRDWKTDFTVRLRQKLLKRGGLPPSSFDGRKLRVRGFVQESRGPLIDITHLKQIEVMP